MDYPHRPVLLREVIKFLISDADGFYVDGTVGSGGHSEAIAARLGTRGRLLCLDRDSEAVRISKERLAPMGNKVTVRKANFIELNSHLWDLGIETADGILLDLGLSSFQLEQSKRGFSFLRDEPLDMRMDPDLPATAHQLVNEHSAKELEILLKTYGEEKRAGLVAKTIDRERRKKTINSSLQLAQLIQSVIPRSHHPGAKNPATRTFQALRIAVNQELENLGSFLDKAPNLVRKGGRLIVISYHSLEDRPVKRAMVNWEKACTCPPDFPRCSCDKIPLFRRLQKKGIKPGKAEIQENPRARSAVLRAAERI